MKIGLALGGGGALGIAHLALLEMLEKKEIKINEICGASAGAIIGLLYASGGINNIENFFNAAKNTIFETRNLVKSPNTTKFYNQLEELLRTYVLEKEFSELEKKLSIIATDLEKGEMSVIDKGDPVKAVLASSAYPGVFPVQAINEVRYIDGGVTRNLPADVLKKRGNNFVIASSLNDKIVINDGKFNRTKIAARAVDITYSEFEKYQEKDADFVFKPKLTEYRWYRFDKVEEILEKARKDAKKISTCLSKEINKRNKIFGII